MLEKIKKKISKKGIITTLVSITVISFGGFITNKFNLIENFFKIDKKEVVEKNTINNTNSNNTDININSNNSFGLSNNSDEWDIRLYENSKINSACFTCRIQFIPQNQTINRTGLFDGEKGKYELNDVPMQIKVTPKNEIKIRDIKIYVFNEKESQYIGVSTSKADKERAGNILVGIYHGNEYNPLEIGISKNRDSVYSVANNFTTNEDEYRNIKNKLEEKASEKKIIEDFDKYDNFYIGFNQYYSIDNIYNQNFYEPKIFNSIISIEDTLGKRKNYFFGYKISYNFIVDNNYEINDGKNIEYVILDEESLLHDNLNYERFIRGDNKPDLTQYIKKEIQLVPNESKGLNSASNYYEEDEINHEYVKLKYDQIISELKKIK